MKIFNEKEQIFDQKTSKIYQTYTSAVCKSTCVDPANAEMTQEYNVQTMLNLQTLANSLKKQRLSPFKLSLFAGFTSVSSAGSFCTNITRSVHHYYY